MKAISLWQPWASGIVAGLKHIETRHWPVPHGIVGKVIAIHAAKRWTRDEREWWYDHVDHPTLGLVNRDGFRQIGILNENDLPLGAIVCTARLYGCRRTEDLLHSGTVSEAEQEWGNYSPGRYGWLLQDIMPVANIPCIGHQGFFDWTATP